MRRLVLAITSVAVLLCGTTTASAAQRLSLTEARATFPQRAYVVALPKARDLEQREISISENGQPVDDLRVSPLGSRSAVVLAIDASESMDDKLPDALAAARVFAQRRLPEQKLGVVFFGRNAVVALEPTTDSGAIDRVLTSSPSMQRGTRVYDAVERAITMIDRAGVAAGSVVVLSDGADKGSVVGLNETLTHARRSRVRLFGVGVESPDFDASSLQALSTAGGTYTQADAAELTQSYAALAARHGREYLVTYQSQQRLESDVAVAMTVTGVADTITAAYRTPDFPSPPAPPDPPPGWFETSAGAASVVLSAALLVGLALWMLVRPIRASIATRITSYTGDSISAEDDARAQRARDLLSAARETRWSRSKPWQAWTLDVELSGLKWAPSRIAGAAVAAAVGLAALLVLMGNGVVAVLVLIGVPAITRLGVKYKATKTRRRFEDQLPDNLQVLASALRAGHSFVAALSVMSKDAPEPSGKEFRRVAREEAVGVPVEASLKVVDDRMKCEDIMYVGLIATLQRETGGNTAEVLDKVVETMRERGKIRRLVRTLTAQGRLGGWIVTALPVLMLVFLNVFKPGYLAPMLEKTIGWVILIFAGIFVALGAYSIRKIVDIKV